MSVIGTGNKIGQSIAFVRLLFAIIVALSCCSSGGYVLIRKEKYTKQTDAIIKSVKCLPFVQYDSKGKKTGTKYDCTIDYTYIVNEVEISDTKKKEFSIEPKSGTKMKLFYDPTNPGDNSFSQGPPKVIGIGIISVACMLVVCSYLLYLVTKRVKGAGTLLTGATAYNYIKG
jgi:hypothetical protein|tara:strand:- start:131 stop:646 length:516 start_codon:yes stop_codon:yes gene_type:complete